jgi:hypothetical protein
MVRGYDLPLFTDLSEAREGFVDQYDVLQDKFE